MMEYKVLNNGLKMPMVGPYNTALEAWSPLAEGKHGIFRNKTLTNIGEKYGKTSAQVALKFLIQNGIVIIPKTTHKERMVENINLFDFNLTDDDLQEIRLLDTGRNVTGWPSDALRYDVYNTYQFSDYSRYDFNAFSEEDKRKYRDEHYDIDLKNAYELGKRLVQKVQL